MHAIPRAPGAEMPRRRLCVSALEPGRCRDSEVVRDRGVQPPHRRVDPGIDVALMCAVQGAFGVIEPSGRGAHRGRAVVERCWRVWGHHVLLRAGSGAVRRRGALWLVFAGPAARSLVRHDLTSVEQMPAPHAGECRVVDRDGQAGQPDRTARTQGLGALELAGRLGEPQTRIVSLAWQLEGRTLTAATIFRPAA